MNLFLVIIGSLCFRCILANSLFYVGPHKPESEEESLVKLSIPEKPKPEKRQISPTKTENITALPQEMVSTTMKNTKRDVKEKHKKSSRRSKLNWDKWKQIGWFELRPDLGDIYVQQHLNGKFCRLGEDGPVDCDDDGTTSSGSIEPDPYDGNGYAKDCNTDELNLQRENVDASRVSAIAGGIVTGQNMFITRALISRTVGRYNTTDDQEPKNGFELFDITMSLVHNICPERTVPQTFLDTVSFFFKELHAHVSPKRTPFISDQETAWIKSILTKCQNRTQRNYRAPTDKTCRASLTPLLANGSYMCNGPPLNQAFHFHERVYDPPLDAIWYIFTSITYLCLRDFSMESSRMFHHYSAAMMDLFTAPMKMRWMTQVSPTSYKKLFTRLIGPFYAYYLENLERCVLYIKYKEYMDDIIIPRFDSYGSVRYVNAEQ